MNINVTTTPVGFDETISIKWEQTLWPRLEVNNGILICVLIWKILSQFYFYNMCNVLVPYGSNFFIFIYNNNRYLNLKGGKQFNNRSNFPSGMNRPASRLFPSLQSSGSLVNSGSLQRPKTVLKVRQRQCEFCNMMAPYPIIGENSVAVVDGKPKCRQGLGN